MIITIDTNKKRQVIDISAAVENELQGDGAAVLFVKHTTAALTTADLDPGTDLDLLDALEAMTPQKQWRHPHDPGHFPDHLWPTLIGTSLSIPFSDGVLQLGTWQRVVLIEFDGPRSREIELRMLEAK
jgi:secondary thiamine-phosphate synthase enzyme